MTSWAKSRPSYYALARRAEVWQGADTTAMVAPPPRKIFYLSALSISLLCLLALLRLPVRCQSLPGASQERPPELLFLVPAQTVQSALGQAEKQTYRLALKAGQYLRLTIEPQGIAVNLMLSTPRGRHVRELDCHEHEVGVRPLSALIVISGTYLLTVRSLETGAQPGAYCLKIAELRQATAQDPRLIAAETADAVAGQLYETWEARASRRRSRMSS